MHERNQACLRLLYCGTGWFPVVEAISACLPPGAQLQVWDRSHPLGEAIRHADVVLPSNSVLDARTITAAPRLRLIQQPAAGCETIDLETARQRGMPVCIAPGMNSQAVAEVALLLMLALARRLPQTRQAFCERRLGEPVGVELTGKTLGLIGYGRSGRRLAETARSLGMHILFTRSSSTRADLKAMLERADFVSIHCPLTAATRGLLDAEALSWLKPGAYLINCARGPIIDRLALEAALDDGRVAGVGLDTYWAEPWDPSDPFFARDNVVTLPHIGGSTQEAFQRIARVVAENVRRLQRGEELLHRIA